MKILFFIDQIGGGGRERRMAQLVKELSNKEVVEMMAVTAYEQVGYKEVFDSRLTIKVVNAPSHFLRLREYEKVVKSFRPDIIHLWIETPMYCVLLPRLAKKYGCKYVAGFVADANPLKRWSIQTLAIRYTFLMADAIVSNSRAGLKAKKAPAGKSHVIYNGFDFARFSTGIDRESKKKELGILSRYVVTMVARVNRAKDWASFIDVADNAKRDNVDATFLAVGGGDLLEAYSDEVQRRELGNIRFLGSRSDVEEILRITDVAMLFTSKVHAEGVSNAIMEAMAARLPVIATAGGGTAEIITDGLSGYIVPMHGVAEAYEQLISLLNDVSQRRFIGSVAQKHICEHFLLSDMGEAYMTLYQEILKK